MGVVDHLFLSTLDILPTKASSSPTSLGEKDKEIAIDIRNKKFPLRRPTEPSKKKINIKHCLENDVGHHELNSAPAILAIISGSDFSIAERSSGFLDSRLSISFSCVSS